MRTVGSQVLVLILMVHWGSAMPRNGCESDDYMYSVINCSTIQICDDGMWHTIDLSTEDNCYISTSTIEPTSTSQTNSFSISGTPLLTTQGLNAFQSPSSVIQSFLPSPTPIATEGGFKFSLERDYPYIAALAGMLLIVAIQCTVCVCTCIVFKAKIRKIKKKHPDIQLIAINGERNIVNTLPPGHAYERMALNNNLSGSNYDLLSRKETKELLITSSLPAGYEYNILHRREASQESHDYHEVDEEVPETEKSGTEMERSNEPLMDRRRGTSASDYEHIVEYPAKQSQPRDNYHVLEPPASPRNNYHVLEPPASPRNNYHVLEPPASPRNNYHVLEPPASPRNNYPVLEPPASPRNNYHILESRFEAVNRSSKTRNSFRNRVAGSMNDITDYKEDMDYDHLDDPGPNSPRPRPHPYHVLEGPLSPTGRNNYNSIDRRYHKTRQDYSSLNRPNKATVLSSPQRRAMSNKYQILDNEEGGSPRENPYHVLEGPVDEGDQFALPPRGEKPRPVTPPITTSCDNLNGSHDQLGESSDDGLDYETPIETKIV